MVSTGGRRLASSRTPLVQNIFPSLTPLGQRAVKQTPGVGGRRMSSQPRRPHPNIPPLVSVFSAISVTLGAYLYMSGNDPVLMDYSSSKTRQVPED